MTSDRLLERIVTLAGKRLASDLTRDLPVSAQGLARHLRRVPPLTTPATSLRVEAFPIFAVPYWMTPEAEREKDINFQIDLAYSTFGGYYAIRLIDNVTDGDGPEELKALLPTTGYFHWRFLQPYAKYFSADHPFWLTFHTTWSDQAERTAQDASLTEITEETFYRVSAGKFGASKVPVAAVAFRYDLVDRFEQWSAFVDALGALVQFWNDFLDWRHDADHGIKTFLQSESDRRRLPTESHAEWFVRDGVSWASDRLRNEMTQVTNRSALLGNDGAAQWVEARRQLLSRLLSDAASDPQGVGTGSTSFGERVSEH